MVETTSKRTSVMIPRLGIEFDEAVLNLAVLDSVQKLGYDSFTEDQVDTVIHHLRGHDVFVSLPTGSGKSLCYACLPYVYNYLRKKVEPVEDIHCSIVVVIEPLTSIMEDQVRKYGGKGMRVAFIGKDQKDETIRDAVYRGEYELVYMSPESMLTVLRWREMFRSETYQHNVVCLAVDEAHCVESWGKKFRMEFSHISEIRALLPKHTSVMALTATASQHSRATIITSLEMVDCHEIVRAPNNLNITYVVVKKPPDPMMVLQPIIEEVCAKTTQAEKYLIFCPTYDVTNQLFQKFGLALGKRGALYAAGSKNRLCNKYDAVTTSRVRKYIISSFTEADGVLRVVFATVAFAMGLDAPNIRRSLHWGPPTDAATYLQGSGRIGRDGQQSTAVLYYNEKDLHSDHISLDIKEYCRNSTMCRRQLLLSTFSPGDIAKPNPLHLCCDVCVKSCTCGTCTNPVPLIDLDSFADDPDDYNPDSMLPKRTRIIPRQIRELIEQDLIAYRHKLCVGDQYKSSIHVFAGVEIVTGITDSVIKNICKQCGHITSITNIVALGVSESQAADILTILKSHIYSC